MDKILVIDNDSAVHKILRKTFGGAGFRVAVATDGNSAMEMFNADMPRIVILEPQTPGFAGQDLCREIRRRSERVPILVLSTAKAEVDKVLLLELGADDYVTKPFSSRELLARVRAAVRRLNQEDTPASTTFSFGDVQVNFLSMEVFRDSRHVKLTPQELKVLRFFVGNQSRVIADDELLRDVWGNRTQPESRTIATHILRLRQKLEKDPTHPVHIRTVHGAGYKFIK